VQRILSVLSVGRAGSSGLPTVFNPPVVDYTSLISRNQVRSWTLFTAANPAIPAGGSWRVQVSDPGALKNAAQWLPSSTLLACGAPSQRLAKLRNSCGGWAAVPSCETDAGQRGAGVAVVAPGAIVRLFDALVFPAILQEYVPGEEYGVFYYRYQVRARSSFLRH